MAKLILTFWVVLSGWLVSIASGQVPAYEKVFSFTDARAADIANKGSSPVAGLVQGPDGTFYGTTENGGASDHGTVFKMTPAGVLTTLVEFTLGRPHGNLVRASDGNFYGTTRFGGAANRGTVFKMTPAGALTTLVEFTGNGASNKGDWPGGLVLGSDGNFYGTTFFGGAADLGTVFKMTPAGTLTTLVEFTGIAGSRRGSGPYAALVQGSDGNLYGTTNNGGTNNHGTVFKMTPAGVLTTLAEFTGTAGGVKGQAPIGGMVEGSDGSFYGATYSGGEFGLGTMFKVTLGGVLTTLLEFTGDGASNRGARPYGGLVVGPDGNFYGTTSAIFGNQGTVFKMTPGGILTTLVEFAGIDGSVPQADLVLASDGNFYGTTNQGGAFSAGTVFKMTPAGGLTKLVDFTSNGASDKGSFSTAGLSLGSDGDLYGTTVGGGAFNLGTVFKVTTGGVLTNVLSFSGFSGISRGGAPQAGLAVGSDGNFYGTTTFGDQSSSYGTVFRMTPGGALTTLVGFPGNVSINNGGRPFGGVLLDPAGNIYGTTSQGGASANGTVFRLTPGGVLTHLVEFTGNGTSNKGASPKAGLVRGNDGNFYGTTSQGGIGYNPGNFEFGFGTIFKVTPAGVLTTLVEFTGNGASNKGANPQAELVLASDGNFYGTTYAGGASDLGTVFRMTPVGVLTTLVEFTGNGASNKGQNPEAALMQTPDGTFYGTTSRGGSFGYDPGNFQFGFGTVFKMTSAGVLTTLVEFSTAQDGVPFAPLVLAGDGNLYGTTAGPQGSIYRLIFPGVPNLFALPAEVQGTASALMQARVNARGASTTVTLEYGTDGVVFPNSVPIAAALGGFQTALVGTTLTNLSPGTTYHYRFRATSGAGSNVSPVQTFSTLAEPIALVNPATDILPTSARFNGTVNARNYASTVVFEYGTDGNTFPISLPAAPPTVTGNTNVAVSALVAGLTKDTTYYYRVVAMNAAGTTVSGASSFRTLTEPVATVGGSFALTTTSARVSGTVRARHASSQVFFDYGTNGTTFPNSVAAAPATVTGDDMTPVSADLPNLAQGVTYHYRVRAVSAGGIGLSAVAQFNLDVLSGFQQQAPAALASEDRQGILIVNVAPASLVGAGWRFIGEQQWRGPGVPVSGLPDSDREIEFRPVTGYYQPARELVTIDSGGPATIFDAEYFQAETLGPTGGMIVLLKPDSLTQPALPVAQRAQWRLLGEDDTAWRESGAELSGLLPGAYLVECKTVAGRTTPPPLSVVVSGGQTNVAAATYYLADPVTGTPPVVVPFETVNTTPDLPYRWVGQLRSAVASGSGFVVKPRVVATAAHMVFDDATLTAAPALQWLYQRDKGTYEPKPQIPRGFYVFTTYAGQRATENTPGESSPVSQNLDAAAVYFLEDAGRGGFGGYLAGDLTPNEWLSLPVQKTLVGYPIAGIIAPSQGRMHATPPANVTFTNSFGRTYTTAEIRSSGGSSGGPLCVQFEGGAYYPAAIYLGGTGQTVVRAIDSDVAEMFRRAEVSANGGNNQGDGGITHTNSTQAGGTATGASLRVNLGPSAVVSTARWQIGSSGTPRSSGYQQTGLIPSSVSLFFTAVPGFITPGLPSGSAVSQALSSGQLTTVTAIYHGITAQPPDRAVTPLASTTFTVSVSGTPTSYRWRRNGANLSNGVTANGTTVAGATGSTLTLSNTQLADAGSYSVVVTWNNGSRTSNAGTLEVQSAMGAWLSQFFTTEEQADPLVSGPGADPGKDGVSVLMAYALNLHPKNNDCRLMTPGTGTFGLPVATRQNVSGQTRLALEFVRRRAASAPGITYRVDFTGNLLNATAWSSTGTETVVPIDSTWERVLVTDTQPATPARFGRLVVTQP